VEEFPILTFYRWSLAGLAAGPEGDIWVLQGTLYENWGESMLERITPTGTLTGSIRLPTDLDGSDIVQGADGNMWITETRGGGEAPDEIARVTPAQEVTEFPITETQNSPGEARSPVSLTRGSDGVIWFTDRRPAPHGPTFIGRINSGGAIAEYPIPTGTSRQLPEEGEPAGIALGEGGDVWFTDDGHDAEGHNLVGEVTPTGTITEYPVPAVGSDPTAITRGADGNMWFTAPGVERVDRVTPSGEVTEFSAPYVSGSLRAIVLGPDGDVWYSEDPRYASAAAPGFGAIAPDGTGKLITPTFVANGEPENLTLGPEGAIWFEDQHFAGAEGEGFTYVGRFTVPFAPTATAPPSISGNAVEGQFLTALPGAWQHEPQAFAYQWQRCTAAGTECHDLPGATAASYGLGSADAGGTMRVLVTATNLAGSTTATSASSATVAEIPPTVVHVRIVGVTLTWRFVPAAHGRSRTRVLTLHHLAPGQTVQTICAGKGCIFGHAHSTGFHAPRCRKGRCEYVRTVGHTTDLNLGQLLGAAKLAPGAVITIVVTQPGQIGKAYQLTVKRHGEPTLRVTCRSPGSLTEMAKC
jgi:streptogramin lyase